MVRDRLESANRLGRSFKIQSVVVQIVMVQVEHSKIDVNLVLAVELKVSLRFYVSIFHQVLRMELAYECVVKDNLHPLDVEFPGDLFIELIVEEHPWFERNGMDLIMSLPLGFSDLALGTTVKLPHIDGKDLLIKVPAGTNSGDTITINSRGVPSSRGIGRGDVVVLCKLHMPKKFDKATRKSLEQLRVTYLEQRTY